ncbi:MAG: hypothetical protein MRZ79_03930 [Bacteroidia bacterium]|nr:hypothetical protein [Bacteroidia bacterium]
MITLIIILTLVFVATSFFGWKWYRLWLIKARKQEKQLETNGDLLKLLAKEQEKWLERTSHALHSNLKSQIHAIDLALFSLKKQVSSSKGIEILKDTSDLTASSLQFIEELGESIIPPMLFTLGLFPALHELSEKWEANIHINVLPDKPEIPFCPNTRTRIFVIIESWLKQSIDEHGADEVFMGWQFIEGHWRLSYRDNGCYSPDFVDDKLPVKLGLILLDLKIHQHELSLSGRSIILKGHF